MFSAVAPQCYAVLCWLLWLHCSPPPQRLSQGLCSVSWPEALCHTGRAVLCCASSCRSSSLTAASGVMVMFWPHPSDGFALCTFVLHSNLCWCAGQHSRIGSAPLREHQCCRGMHALPIAACLGRLPVWFGMHAGLQACMCRQSPVWDALGVFGQG